MNVRKQSDHILPPHYTVVCFFQKSQLEKVVKLIEKLRPIDTRQYFYLPEQLHLTLYAMIDISSDKETIVKVVQDFLDDNRIKFHLLGVGSFADPRSVTACPIGFRLSTLRDKLRAVGGGKRLSNDYENLGWINFMRFLTEPRDELLEAARKEAETDFGMVEPKSIQLLKTSNRVLEGAEVIHEFKIRS